MGEYSSDRPIASHPRWRRRRGRHSCGRRRGGKGNRHRSGTRGRQPVAASAAETVRKDGLGFAGGAACGRPPRRRLPTPRCGRCPQGGGRRDGNWHGWPLPPAWPRTAPRRRGRRVPSPCRRLPRPLSRQRWETRAVAAVGFSLSAALVAAGTSGAGRRERGRGGGLGSAVGRQRCR